MRKCKVQIVGTEIRVHTIRVGIRGYRDTVGFLFEWLGVVVNESSVYMHNHAQSA